MHADSPAERILITFIYPMLPIPTRRARGFSRPTGAYWTDETDKCYHTNALREARHRASGGYTLPDVRQFNRMLSGRIATSRCSPFRLGSGLRASFADTHALPVELYAADSFSGSADVRKGTNAKPETERLRDQAVRAFNKGNTQAEVGAMLGITRHAVGRLIAEARAMGVSTVHYSTVETSLRSLASRRSRQAQTATDN